MAESRKFGAKPESISFVPSTIASLLAIACLNSCAIVAPVNYDYHRRLWEKAFTDASMELSQGDSKTAEVLFKRALVESKSLKESDIRLAITQLALSGVYRLERKDAEALRLLQQAFAILSSLRQQNSAGADDDGTSEELANTLTEIAGIYFARGQNSLSLDYCNKAIQLYDEIWKREKNKLLGQHFAKALFEMACLEEKAGQLHKSCDLYRRAFIIEYWSGGSTDGMKAIVQRYRDVLQALGEPHEKPLNKSIKPDEFDMEVMQGQDLWAQLLQEGTNEQALGHLSSAEEKFADSLAVAEKCKLMNDCLIKSLEHLLSAKAVIGKPDQTISTLQGKLVELLKQEIAAMEKAHGPNDPALLKPLFELSGLYYALNLSMDIVPFAKRVELLSRQNLKREDILQAIGALEDATCCCAYHGDKELAEHFGLTKLALVSQIYQPGDEVTVIFHNLTMVQIYTQTRQQDKEMQHIKSIKELIYSRSLESSLDAAVDLAMAANNCRSLKRNDYALEFTDRAAYIMAHNQQKITATYRKYVPMIADNYKALGKTDRAADWLKTMAN